MRRMIGAVFFAATAIVALVQMKSCTDKAGQSPKIPAIVQRELDSLRLFRRSYDSAQTADSIRRAQDSVARVAAQQHAAVAERSARQARKRADSLAQSAETAAEWKAAHDQRQEEAVQWEQTAERTKLALGIEIQAHARTKFMLMEAQTRQRLLEDRTVPSLVRVTETLEKPCRLLLVPCPSRTVVGIVSAGLGVAGGYYLGQAKK